ncbi:glycosyltransferase [Patescibacteria group bacterium]
MKILILTKVPAEYEKYRRKSQDIPTFQAQYFWKKTLKEMGHSVKIIRYSDPVFFSIKFSKKVEQLLSNTSPGLWQKFRLFKNKFYYLFPQNHVRTEKIARQVKEDEFDLIIISGGCSELIPNIFKDFDNKVLLLHGEDPNTSATQFEKDSLPYIYGAITNDKFHAENWEKLGAKKALAIPYTGIDSNTHKDFGEKRDIDLIFVGSLFEERQKQLLKLIEFSPHIYGYVPKSTNLHPKLKKHYKGEAWGDKVVSIYNQAKIAINFVPSHMRSGGNTRTFRIPACGALQLTNKCPKEWFENGKEVVVFKNTNDLRNKIKKLLSSPKKVEKISKSGYKKAHSSHNYKKRFSKILSI